MYKRFVFAMAIAALVAFTLFPNSAKADNFSQEFNETCPTCTTGVSDTSNTFTGIDIFSKTTGVTFSDAGSTSDSGWTETLVNSGFEQLTGEAVSSLNFNVDLFSANANDDVVLDFYALLNGQVVDSATFTYPVDGQPYNWEIGSLPAGNITGENVTPEPSSLLLLGTGLLGLAFVAFRRAKNAGHFTATTIA